MKNYGNDYPEWFFVWITGEPYITTRCGWSKKSVIRMSENETGLTWKQIYRRGGRVKKFALKEQS